MAYVTGSASNYADLLTAIRNALTANGWTLTSGILSKDIIHVNLRTANPFTTGTKTALIASIGNSSSGGALTGTPSTVGAKIGPFTYTSNTEGELTFPCVYKVFININPDEVYIVVRYNVDEYQWIAFGKSPSPGSSGNGTWLGGTFGQPASGTTTSNNRLISSNQAFYISNSGGGGAGNSDATCAGLFMNDQPGGVTTPTNNCTIHSGTAGSNGWSIVSVSENPNAYYAVANMMAVSPNNWNLQSTLFKINPSIPVTGNKVQLIGNIMHSRYIKINYIEPETIITLGPDKWMVFPWYKKSTSDINGYMATTGYFGWAIRYDGP